MKRIQMKSLVIISMIVIFFSYQLYQIYEDHQIVSLINSFSRSTQCEITLSSGVEIVIEGTEWKNIAKDGVGFFINGNGRKTYKEQELVNLMEIKLYNDNIILSELQIKEIVSSDEVLNILHTNATLPVPESAFSGEENQAKYYDEINGRKIMVIGEKQYCTNLEEFLQPLFDYLNENDYLLD